MSQDYWKENINFEKRYSVYMEKSDVHIDGYKYHKFEEAPMVSNNKNFCLVFHFKKVEKSINPSLIVDSMKGNIFSEKMEIIAHFKKNHALSYAVSIDGFGELTKEDKND